MSEIFQFHYLFPNSECHEGLGLLDRSALHDCYDDEYSELIRTIILYKAYIFEFTLAIAHPTLEMGREEHQQSILFQIQNFIFVTAFSLLYRGRWTVRRKTKTKIKNGPKLHFPCPHLSALLNSELATITYKLQNRVLFSLTGF